MFSVCLPVQSTESTYNINYRNFENHWTIEENFLVEDFPLPYVGK